MCELFMRILKVPHCDSKAENQLTEFEKRQSRTRRSVAVEWVAGISALSMESQHAPASTRSELPDCPYIANARSAESGDSNFTPKVPEIVAFSWNHLAQLQCYERIASEDIRERNLPAVVVGFVST